MTTRSPRLDGHRMESDISHDSQVLPHAFWGRQTSPVMVCSSFELTDGPENLPWRPFGRQATPLTVSQHSNELSQRNYSTSTSPLSEDPLRDGMDGEETPKYTGGLLSTLVLYGWIPQLSFGVRKNMIPFIVTMTFQLFLALTAPHDYSCGPWKKPLWKSLHFANSAFYHVAMMVTQLGMYFIGGTELYTALWVDKLSIPRPNFMALCVLLVMEMVLDASLLANPYECEGGWWPYSLGVRRMIILLGRVPGAVSQMVMMSIPKRLCLDLVEIAKAVEEKDIYKAESLYGVFWNHLRLGRNWYNAVMTPHFLIAVSRMLVGFFIITHRSAFIWDKYAMGRFLAYLTIEMFQMLVWIQPAIVIRRNHGVVLRSVVVAAGHHVENAQELATLMGSLHPLVGLKMFGFFVTWRLVTQVSAIGSIAMSLLRYMLEKDEK